MDELISTVSQRAGINQDQARAAVQTVLDHLKTRLPEPLASQLEQLLQSGGTGGTSGQGLVGDVEGMLRGSGG